ncbi:hypothetical protein NX059_005799 [Plenodomus lindquistii]|nr:hypothetical protein NX059_005799 [Plenodomus lindquistii]
MQRQHLDLTIQQPPSPGLPIKMPKVHTCPFSLHKSLDPSSSSSAQLPHLQELLQYPVPIMVPIHNLHTRLPFPTRNPPTRHTSPTTITYPLHARNPPHLHNPLDAGTQHPTYPKHQIILVSLNFFTPVRLNTSTVLGLLHKRVLKSFVRKGMGGCLSSE